MTIAIVGGTGKLGQSLALKWARGGKQIIIGSRSKQKGERLASALSQEIGRKLIFGKNNTDAVKESSIAISTLPAISHIDILSKLKPWLADKILVTTTVSWPPSSTITASAAEQLQQKLGNKIAVVAAFQTVSALTLRHTEKSTEDVLVFGNTTESVQQVCDLVEKTGLRSIIGGELVRTRAAEQITGLLININSLYGVKSTGLRITGLEGCETKHRTRKNNTD